MYHVGQCNHICKQLWSCLPHFVSDCYCRDWGVCINGFRVYQSKYGFNCTEVKRSCHLIIYINKSKCLFKLKVKSNFSQEMKYQIKDNILF